MSLEQTIERTNTLLEQLLSVLTTGLEARTTLFEVEAAKPTRTRKAKDEPAATTTPTTTATSPLGLVEGDPQGTRYWVIAKHNTVYAQKPGDPDPGIEGAKIESAAEYLRMKAEFAKKSATGSTEAKPAATTAPAPSPAPDTQSASTASSSTQGDAVPFTKIVERITALMKSEAPGHGKQAVLDILRKYLPNEAKPTVTLLQPLGRNTEVLADIEAALGAGKQAEEDFDPLG